MNDTDLLTDAPAIEAKDQSADGDGSVVVAEAAGNKAGEASSAPPSIVRISVDSVIVGEKRRDIDSEAVTELSKSMKTIGLRTPITIRIRTTELAPGRTFTEHHLVAGLHRLEAARSLGWHEIDCFVLQGDQTDARKWEIGENLHRKELTELERDVYIAEWLDLAAKESGQHVRKATGGRPKGGLAEAARELPVPGKSEEAKRKTVERAMKIAAIAPEAKEAAIAAGLANNQRALLAVADEKTKDAQVEMVKKRAAHKRAKFKKSPAVQKAASTISPPVAPFRTTESEDKALRNHAAGIGSDISPDDLIVAADSKSATARPSEYAVVRIPESHPDREELKRTILRLRDEYNTHVFFKTLPELRAEEGGLGEENETEVSNVE